MRKVLMDEGLHWLQEFQWGCYMGVGESSGCLRCVMPIDFDDDYVGVLKGSKTGLVVDNSTNLPPKEFELCEVYNSKEDGIIYTHERLLAYENEGLERENWLQTAVRWKWWRKETDLLKSVIVNAISSGSTLVDICPNQGDRFGVGHNVSIFQYLPMPPVAVVRRWMLRDKVFAEAIAIAEKIRAGVFHDKVMTGDIDDPELMKELRSRFTWGAEMGDRDKFAPKQDDSSKKVVNNIKMIVVDTGVTRQSLGEREIKKLEGSNTETTESSQ